MALGEQGISVRNQKIPSFYCYEGKDGAVSGERGIKRFCWACKSAVILTLPPCHGDLHNM